MPRPLGKFRSWFCSGLFGLWTACYSALASETLTTLARKLGGRVEKYRATKADDARFHFGIDEARVGLHAERRLDAVDDETLRVLLVASGQWETHRSGGEEVDIDWFYPPAAGRHVGLWPSADSQGFVAGAGRGVQEAPMVFRFRDRRIGCRVDGAPLTV